MSSGYKTSLFNPALAGLAAGAAAFAIFAMPRAMIEAGIDAAGLSAVIDFQIGAAARIGLMVIGAGLAFLTAWFALRSCDRPRTQPEAEAPLDEDWLAQRLHGRSAPIDPAATCPMLAEEAPDDPFAELARGAERVEAPLELSSEHIVPGPPASIEERDDLASGTPYVPMPLTMPAAVGASSLIQRLNADLVESEWPIPPGSETEGAAPDVEDRLRDVLQNLHVMARRA